MKMLDTMKLLPKAGQVFEQVKTKGWAQSKTIWANLITLVSAGVLAIVGVDVGLSTEAVASLSASAVAVSNIVLRFTTKGPVGLQPKAKPMPVVSVAEGGDESTELHGYNPLDD